MLLMHLTCNFPLFVVAGMQHEGPPKGQGPGNGLGSRPENQPKENERSEESESETGFFRALVNRLSKC